jgi:hypothetical protein
MVFIDVQVTLLLRKPCCASAVRLWIDLDPHGPFETETKLALRPLAPRGERRSWAGSFIQCAAAAEPFLYRLGLIAHPGAEFSLHMYDRGVGRDLLSDSDVLPLAKCMLVGNCSPARVRPAPKLTLLRGLRASE